LDFYLARILETIRYKKPFLWVWHQIHSITLNISKQGNRRHQSSFLSVSGKLIPCCYVNEGGFIVSAVFFWLAKDGR
jgi:hypothetical protein